jgi:hypothetical protein
LLYCELRHIVSKIVMIPNLTSIIIILIVATPILLLIMFLPTILELKKPKDEGPRMIMGSIPEVKTRTVHVIHIANIEKEQKFDISLIQTMAKIIEVLTNLEV